MGFHPAHKYRFVHKLIFEDGGFIRGFDRLVEVARYREAMAGELGLPFRKADKHEIEVGSKARSAWTTSAMTPNLSSARTRQKRLWLFFNSRNELVESWATQRKVWS